MDGRPLSAGSGRQESSVSRPDKRKSIIDVIRKGWRNSTNTDAVSRELYCGFNRLSPELPLVIEQTCLYLEQHALQQEGIFRISGSMNDIKQLKRAFDKGRKANLDRETNAHTVAGVLKLFFVELPNPILTFELYSAFMAASAIAEPVECRLACVRRVIERLPPGNRSVIKRVTAMFKVIQNFSEQNKMTAKNISIVMGPTMFRSKDESIREVMTTGGLRVRLIQHMILDHDALFLAPLEQVEAPLREVQSQSEALQKAIKDFYALLQRGTIHLAQSIISEGGEDLMGHTTFDHDFGLVVVPQAVATTTTTTATATDPALAEKQATRTLADIERVLAAAEANGNLGATNGVGPGGRRRGGTGRRAGIRIDTSEMSEALKNSDSATAAAAAELNLEEFDPALLAAMGITDASSAIAALGGGGGGGAAQPLDRSIDSPIASPPVPHGSLSSSFASPSDSTSTSTASSATSSGKTSTDSCAPTRSTLPPDSLTESVLKSAGIVTAAGAATATATATATSPPLSPMTLRAPIDLLPPPKSATSSPPSASTLAPSSSLSPTAATLHIPTAITLTPPSTTTTTTISPLPRTTISPRTPSPVVVSLSTTPQPSLASPKTPSLGAPCGADVASPPASTPLVVAAAAPPAASSSSTSPSSSSSSSCPAATNPKRRLEGSPPPPPPASAAPPPPPPMPPPLSTPVPPPQARPKSALVILMPESDGEEVPISDEELTEMVANLMDGDILKVKASLDRFAPDVRAKVSARLTAALQRLEEEVGTE